jgi:polysaccharide biosynthesis PFTS motif protein
MKKSSTFYVPQLHILNLPLIFLLRFLGPVVIFKYRGICRRFLNSSRFFNRIDDFQNVDQWRNARAQALEQLKANFQFTEQLSFRDLISNEKIDSSRVFLQSFAKDYEQTVFLLELAKASPRPCIVGTSFLSYLKALHPRLYPDIPVLGLPFTWLDGLYEFSLNQLAAAKILVKIFYPQAQRFDFKKFKYIFTGISAVEYPTTQLSLNFAWPVFNQVTTANETLFILDVEPDQRSRSILNEKSVQFVTRRSLMASLSTSVKLKISLDIIKRSLCFERFYRRNFKFICYLQNRAWLAIFKELKAQYFIYSFSAGWPELPETCIANSLGIKTINWFYGTSEFGYTTDLTPFRDQSVRFCVREASQLWVWNHLNKDLIESRSFFPSLGRIEVVGPLLNGNWNALSNTEKAQENTFKIVAFDITPMRAHMRLQYGEGPYCNADLQEQIYQALWKIHQTFPNVTVAIKTKRTDNPEVFYPQPALQKLREAVSDRIQFIPPSDDPYLAIKDADLVISTPYTSPSILAITLGQRGIFYDPLGIAKHTYKEAFRGLTLYSEKDLLAHIESLIAGRDDGKIHYNKEHFPSFTPDQIAAGLRERLK